MGAAAGFGQSMSGQTGVGSASTQTGQTGGKGGGFGTPTSAQNPYASSQPQTQQIPAQPYQPLGGNAYGYNMARLARQMDPSASLPMQQPQQFTTQQAQAAPTGGKGGGQPGVFGIPQEFEPFAVDMLARSYGYQPYQPSFFQPQTQAVPQTQQQQNPFDQGYSAQQERMAQMDRQYQDLLNRMQTQQRDFGEILADLPKAYEEQNLGVGKTAEQIAAEPKVTPPPSALASGAGFRDINTQYGGMLGNVNATVDSAGRVVLTSNTNKNLKTTLPAGSYFDSTKNQFVDASGKALNVGSQFLSSTAPGTASSGIQFGDTAADIRREFGNVVNVTDTAKINPDGSITLGGGTKVPAGSYVDSGGVLRQPNGTPVVIKPKDIPVRTTQAPAPAPATAVPSPSPATPTPAPAAPSPAPAATPAPAPTAPSPAPTAQTKSAAVTAAKEAGVKGAGGMSAQQLANATGAPVVNAKGQTIQPKKAVGGIIHTGMTSNLKKMLKNK